MTSRPENPPARQVHQSAMNGAPSRGRAAEAAPGRCAARSKKRQTPSSISSVRKERSIRRAARAGGARRSGLAAARTSG